MIPIDVAEHIEIKVDGVPVMACGYGIRNGQYALKVERFLAEEES